MVNNVENIGQLHDVALGNPEPQRPREAWPVQIDPNNPQQGTYWTPKRKSTLGVALLIAAVVVGLIFAVTAVALSASGVGLPLGAIIAAVATPLTLFIAGFLLLRSTALPLTLPRQQRENPEPVESSQVNTEDAYDLPDGGPDSRASYGSQQAPVSQQDQDDYDLHLPGRNDIPADPR